MKPTPILMGLLACAWLTGCASTPDHAGIETVGPHPSAGVTQTNDHGTLIVYSAFAIGADFYNRNPYGRRYTDYKIMTSDGRLYQKVHNDNGTLNEDASPVDLPAGSYQIRAQSNGHGNVTVPIVIASHQTTVLHLEGGGAWQKREELDDANAVHLPSGEIIGYRSASN